MPKAKPLPTPEKLVTWKAYLAEDIRQEMDGRVSLIGLYHIDTVVLQMPATAPDPTPAAVVGVSGLAILLTLTGVNEPKEFTLKLIAPDGQVVTEGAGVLAVGEASNLISRFKPFAVTGFGEWTWAVRGEGVHVDYKFRAVRGPIAYDPLSGAAAGPGVGPVAKQVTKARVKSVAKPAAKPKAKAAAKKRA